MCALALFDIGCCLTQTNRSCTKWNIIPLAFFRLSNQCEAMNDIFPTKLFAHQCVMFVVAFLSHPLRYIRLFVCPYYILLDFIHSLQSEFFSFSSIFLFSVVVIFLLVLCSSSFVRHVFHMRNECKQNGRRELA